ncbi:MAG: serine/threonine-protein kinase [Polyangiaceae bacterium]
MPEPPKPPPAPPRRPAPPPPPGGAAYAPTVELDSSDAVDAPDTGVPPKLKEDGYVGRTIDGRYLIERVVGEGGMGVVYAARHKVIDKRVAIKVLRGEMATDHEANERFLQEARAASAIGNPHIVDISDFGQLPDGSTYFVMEFLAGKSLSAVIGEAKGPIPVPRLCHIAKQIAQGLAAAHAANIIHRDLKPDNVMLVQHGTEKDFVKILDFGIAKVGSGTKRMTRAGSVFGTPHYMSPEQAAGTPVDHRTDIYALGVMLYEMASGKVPFDADNFMGILTQHMYKAPVPIRALVPEVDVPPGLDAIVLKSLTKKPEGRYANMDQVVAELERLEDGLMPDAVQELMARSGAFNVPSDYFRSQGMPEPVPGEPTLPRQRWPLYAVIGAVATVLGVIGVVVLGKSSAGTAQTAPPVAAVTSVLPPAAAPAAAPSLPAASVTAIAPAPPAQREVLVSAVPSDATLARDGKELGQGPVALHLADGEGATLVVARKGYKTKTVTVDASEPKQTITLEATWTSTGRPPQKAQAPAAPNNAGLDDVGDPFAKH